MLSVVFPEASGSLPSFFEKTYAIVWIVSLSIVLSSKNGSPEKERLVQLRLKQLQNYFGMQK